MTILARFHTVLLSCLCLWALAADAQIIAGGQAGGQVGGGVGPSPRSQATPPAPLDLAIAVSIEGRVVNALTGAPIRQANVTVTIVTSGPREGMNGGQPPRYVATSDAQGQFKLSNIQPGRYLLSAEKTGFVGTNVGASLARDGGPLVGEPGQKISGAEIKLTPQAIIAGKVLDENGDPVANASIRVMPLSGYFKQTTGDAGGASTNAIGEFLIGGLRSGRYVLRVDYGTERFGGPAAMAASEASAESYVPTYYPNTVDAKAASSIVVAAGQEVRGIDIWLQKARVYRVSGKVEGLSGEGSQRFQVSLLRLGQSGREALSNFRGPSRGTFDFLGVQPGLYAILATLLSGNERPQPLPVVYVTVTDADVAGINIQGIPVPPMTITGIVKREYGQPNPFQGAVRLLPEAVALQIGRNSEGQVRADGTFEIKSVTPGKYTINYLPAPSGMYLKGITAGGADILTNGLDLSQQQVLPPIEIILGSKPGVVQGTVKNEGEPFLGAFVTLLPDPVQPGTQRLQRSTTSTAGGQFSFKDLSPGEYRLFAWKEQVPLRIITAEELKPYDSYCVRVSVKEGEQAQAELTVVPLP